MISRSLVLGAYTAVAIALATAPARADTTYLFTGMTSQEGRTIDVTGLLEVTDEAFQRGTAHLDFSCNDGQCATDLDGVTNNDGIVQLAVSVFGFHFPYNLAVGDGADVVLTLGPTLSGYIGLWNLFGGGDLSGDGLDWASYDIASDVCFGCWPVIGTWLLESSLSSVTVPPVPEPSGLFLLLSALFVMGMASINRREKEGWR